MMTKKDIDASLEKWLPNGKWIAIIIFVATVAWTANGHLNKIEISSINKEAAITTELKLIRQEITRMQKDLDKIKGYLDKAYGYNVSFTGD